MATLTLAALAFSAPRMGPSATYRLAGFESKIAQPRPVMAMDSRRAFVQTAAVAISVAPFLPAEAVGPVNMDLDIIGYEEVACPPELAAGRIGGSLGAAASKGVKQRCVKVTAKTVNPKKETITDAAVFGRVFNVEDNNSVVANNQDGRTDAGQITMIERVGPGETQVEFVFVTTDNKATQTAIPKLRFESMKAISYPGGSRYKVYDPCEQNPAMDGCGMDD